jgi:Domain of unknown function (DUF4253)
MQGEGFPQGLERLFSEGSAPRFLDVELPPGRVVRPNENDEGLAAAYWVSDGPVSPDLWVRLRRAHVRSGLWPVLADPMAASRGLPLVTGDVRPQPTAGIGGLDAGAVMAALWAAWVQDGEGQSDFRELRPFSRTWPGLAAATDGGSDPDTFADQYVLGNDDGTSRIMLVPVTRSADVVTALGWQGPLNHTEDMASLSAVLRSWEARFGARLIELGFDTLHLAVAAPPATATHAQRVGAEHFAFCPDNIVQGPSTINAYAAGIRGRNGWTFWWD